jgi:geranylgeranyl diphosphate synthase, type I
MTGTEPQTGQAPALRQAQQQDRTELAARQLERCRAVAAPVLRSATDTLPSALCHVAGYHLGWWDAQGTPEAADGGKAIRPALTLLAAEAVGGAVEAAVPAATAVELVHNFSLLHDDVMDGDLTRRHRFTAWHVFGANPALLTGNAMLSLAFDILSASNDPTAQQANRTLHETVTALLEGQAADLAFEQRDDVGLAECVRMAQAKTGALLAGACALGARFGGGSRDQIQHLRTFGEKIGLAFQLVDDLLGIWGDPVLTGKPVYSDLRSRKKSLPVVAALSFGTPAGAELADLYRQGPPLTDDQLARAAELVAAAGGRDWCQRQADALFTDALRQLDQAGLPARRAELEALARLITRRDH